MVRKRVLIKLKYRDKILQVYDEYPRADHVNITKHQRTCRPQTLNMVLSYSVLHTYPKGPFLERGRNIVIRYYKCMTSTQELIGIHNDVAGKSWSKYTTDIKVGKVNYNKYNIKCKCKNYPGSKRSL